MKFIRDLIHWFIYGSRRNDANSEAVPTIEEIVKTAAKPAEKPVEKEPENPVKTILEDLKSLRSENQQISSAKEDLLKELQRLAPPKKRILDIFKRAA